MKQTGSEGIFLQVELRVLIRPCRLDDFEAIEEIENSAFDDVERFDHAKFEQLYQEQNSFFLVAEVDGSIVGYTVGQVSGSDGNVDSAAVDQFFRNLGIGRRLIESLLRLFIERQVEICSLEVRTDNISAIHLYERLGFRRAETLKDFYAKGRDAYKMSLNIGERNVLKS